MGSRQGGSSGAWRSSRRSPRARALAARRACGGVEQEKPRKNVGVGRAPIAVGDSPMLLALARLADSGYRANARGCRQYREGLALIRDLRRRDKLPRLVVIALGSNGTITKGNIHDALDIVGKKRTLGLVTPRETGGGAGHDAARPRRGAQAREADQAARLGQVQRRATPPGFSPTACT